jgi:hypothetical protein
LLIPAEQDELGENPVVVGVLKRRSPYKDTAMLLAELVQRGIRTLVFVKVRDRVHTPKGQDQSEAGLTDRPRHPVALCQVRYIAELILQMTREKLPDSHRDRVASYRSGAGSLVHPPPHRTPPHGTRGWQGGVPPPQAAGDRGGDRPWGAAGGGGDERAGAGGGHR